jgi:hypothetical protein
MNVTKEPRLCGCGECGRVMPAPGWRRGPKRKYHPECNMSDVLRKRRDRDSAPSWPERKRRAELRKQQVEKRVENIAEQRAGKRICGKCNNLAHRVEGARCILCGLQSGTGTRDTVKFIRNQALLKTGA